MNRRPGGICIFLGAEEVEIRQPDRIDDDHYTETYWRILHPDEGIVFEPSWYYDTLEELSKNIDLSILNLTDFFKKGKNKNDKTNS